jgi:hypothetical protein
MISLATNIGIFLNIQLFSNKILIKIKVLSISISPFSAKEDGRKHIFAEKKQPWKTQFLQRK